MRKIGLIAMALVLALGALGVGFAAWTDTVTVAGTVDSGNVCVGFTNWIVLSDPCSPGTPDSTCDVGFGNEGPAPENKNVGCTSATRVDQHTIAVTLTDVYPCYFATVSVHAVNCGTIPIKLEECELTYDDGTGPQTVPLADSSVVRIQGPDQYGGTSDVMELKWVNGTGAQLEPGDEHEDSFHIHILQPAMPGSTYTFTISRMATQWNEYPYQP